MASSRVWLGKRIVGCCGSFGISSNILLFSSLDTGGQSIFSLVVASAVRQSRHWFYLRFRTYLRSTLPANTTEYPSHTNGSSLRHRVVWLLSAPPGSSHCSCRRNSPPPSHRTSTSRARPGFFLSLFHSSFLGISQGLPDARRFHTPSDNCPLHLTCSDISNSRYIRYYGSRRR